MGSKFRTKDVNIGVPARLVEQKLYDLTLRLPYWPETLASVTELHHQLVYIHPYKNGNGRWSRFVANIRQVMTTETITVWPHAEMTSDSRSG
ncbi:Fic family protein [Limnoglobus roseus]|uniref:Mobile mystery protein B n=1 Tax=Limnoglobus roseus TaxID=2598579 RepID=A0A5C1AMZ7_9BACT|nr:Fic family protein [Limnoglobus roseus]QEL19493.1 mobile mystery protein B [Limnoglobus roseus]